MADSSVCRKQSNARIAFFFSPSDAFVQVEEAEGNGDEESYCKLSLYAKT